MRLHLQPIACVLAAAMVIGLMAGPPAASQDDDRDMELLPDAPGRDTTYVVCSGCHSIRLVAQQGLPRSQWSKLLVWMVEEQGMAELDPETEGIVLDYLSDNLNIDHEPPPPIQ